MAAPRQFFVDFNTHNGDSDSWNFKQTKRFEDYDSARKEYYSALSQYIQYGKLDHVGVVLYDSFGNMLDNAYWDKPEEPNEE